MALCKICAVLGPRAAHGWPKLLSSLLKCEPKHWKNDKRENRNSATCLPRASFLRAAVGLKLQCINRPQVLAWTLRFATGLGGDHFRIHLLAEQQCVSG